jgi:hypothetical protein
VPAARPLPVRVAVRLASSTASAVTCGGVTKEKASGEFADDGKVLREVCAKCIPNGPSCSDHHVCPEDNLCGSCRAFTRLPHNAARHRALQSLLEGKPEGTPCHVCGVFSAASSRRGSSRPRRTRSNRARSRIRAPLVCVQRCRVVASARRGRCLAGAALHAIPSLTSCRAIVVSKRHGRIDPTHIFRCCPCVRGGVGGRRSNDCLAFEEEDTAAATTTCTR